MLDYKQVFRALSSRKVDYVVVGGVSAALSGAPIITLDLDLVHSRTPGNIPPLLQALAELEAVYRDPAGRIIRPTESHLISSGHQLLKTKWGPLDLLGTVGVNPKRSYQDLLSQSHERMIAGFAVRVLDLATLIQLKEELRREKDLMVLPVLRRALQEQEREQNRGG